MYVCVVRGEPPRRVASISVIAVPHTPTNTPPHHTTKIQLIDFNEESNNVNCVQVHELVPTLEFPSYPQANPPTHPLACAPTHPQSFQHPDEIRHMSPCPRDASLIFTSFNTNMTKGVRH